MEHRNVDLGGGPARPPATLAIPADKPLSPAFHRILVRRFGEVRIARAGEAMQHSQGIDPVTMSPRLLVTEYGETYCVNCPFCNDTRKRLWLTYMYGQPDPLRPGYHMTHFGVCYNEDCLRNKVNRKRLEEMLFGLRNRNDPLRMRLPLEAAATITTATLGPTEPPGTVLRLSELYPGHPALQYLAVERRLDLAVLEHYGVGYCTDASPQHRQVQDRIVIPFYFNGEYVGWQARYVGDDMPYGTPKYLTCTGMPKTKFLYNCDRAKIKPYVVVVEGVTDVWAIGDHAVSILGKKMSQRQLEIIQHNWLRQLVVLVLDPDAQAETAEAKAMLEEVRQGYSNPVVVVQLPDGYDPARYAREQINNIIRAAVVKDGKILPE